MRLAPLLCAVLVACSANPRSRPPRRTRESGRPPSEATSAHSDLAKSDIDLVTETNARESLASARLVMEKLYRRNPRELRKGTSPTMDAALARAFDPATNSASPSSATSAARTRSFLRSTGLRGDRVFAFGVGLASMVFLSYGGKTDSI
jgi:hypothetical protein